VKKDDARQMSVAKAGHHVCQAAELEANDDRNEAEVRRGAAAAAAAAADDDDDDELGVTFAAFAAASKIEPETPTKSPHVLSVIHASASGFAAEDGAGDWPSSKTLNSEAEIEPS
jgi:hypothetical protein